MYQASHFLLHLFPSHILYQFLISTTLLLDDRRNVVPGGFYFIGSDKEGLITVDGVFEKSSIGVLGRNFKAILVAKVELYRLDAHTFAGEFCVYLGVDLLIGLDLNNELILLGVALVFLVHKVLE